MSTALERRMIKLEAAARPEENGIQLIVRRIIRTDFGEVARAIIGDKPWTAKPANPKTTSSHGQRSKAWPAPLLGSGA
jgi:hypothetical protein